MPIGAKTYHDVATYWGTPIQGGFGEKVFATPVLLKCRWEDVTEIFIDMEGNEKRSRAKVWTYTPLDIDGYIAKGDHRNVSDPTSIDTALFIQRVDDIPDLRGLHAERVHYL
jgi:hypothetical protein